MNYGVLFGGRSYEHDISVITATQVAAALNGNVFPIYARNGEFFLVRDKMEVSKFAKNRARFTKIRFDSINEKGLIRYGVHKIDIDCMVMCCHGGEGEDGRFSALMEVYGFPYTASSPFVSALTMDKVAEKVYFDRYNIKNAKGVSVRKGEKLSFSDLRFPLIVKPSHLGSSIGIRAAHNEEELSEALDVAFSFDDEVLIEEMIRNVTELNCAAFSEGEEIILSAVERPVTWHEFLTFDDKYRGGKYKVGSNRFEDNALTERVRELTEKVYRSLGLFGIARIDFLYDEAADELYVNEVNSQPGSMAYSLFEKVGISFPSMITRVAAQAIERYNNKGIIRFNSGVLDNLCDFHSK